MDTFIKFTELKRHRRLKTEDKPTKALHPIRASCPFFTWCQLVEKMAGLWNCKRHLNLIAEPGT
jgi:hypothetical protein